MEKKYKILIVDSIESWIVLIKYQIEEFGLPVVMTFARTIEDARKELGSQEFFDIIFIDGTISQCSPHEFPETLPLIEEAMKTYSGRIYFTSVYLPYAKCLKDRGVQHIEKNDIPQFLKEFLTPTDFEDIAYKAPLLTKDSLLVINMTRAPYLPLDVYVAKVISTSPVQLKIKENGYIFFGAKSKATDEILKPGDFRILYPESIMLQGNTEQQAALFKKYEDSKKSIYSGLSEFGGDIRKKIGSPILQ